MRAPTRGSPGHRQLMRQVLDQAQQGGRRPRPATLDLTGVDDFSLLNRAAGVSDALTPAPLRPSGGLIGVACCSRPTPGGRTALRLATDPGLAAVTGEYLRRETETSTPR